MLEPKLAEAGDVSKMSAKEDDSEARLEGFEPTTPGSEDRCSCPLSYRRECGVSGGIRTLDLQGHNLAP